MTYGGHGVWGWDDGRSTPTAHPLTGIPLPWQQALVMPAAEHVQHLHQLFASVDWWRLRPAPELLDPQPINSDPARANVAARTDAGDLALIYIPSDRRLPVKTAALAAGVRARWFNPRTGETVPLPGGPAAVYETPAAGDWVLLFTTTPASEAP